MLSQQLRSDSEAPSVEVTDSMIERVRQDTCLACGKKIQKGKARRGQCPACNQKRVNMGKKIPNIDDVLMEKGMLLPPNYQLPPETEYDSVLADAAASFHTAVADQIGEQIKKRRTGRNKGVK